ncbi:MAG: exosortase A [Candidatus Competibacteraceae bacterium]
MKPLLNAFSPRSTEQEGVAFNPGWRVALSALLVALTGIALLYGPTIASMATQWWNYETYAHGMLVVPIILYMVWTRRQNLAKLEPRSAAPGLVFLLLLSLGWLAAEVAQVSVARQFALVGIMQAAVYTLLGWNVAWAIAFPLAYLLFAVPVGEALIPPLQQVTAWFTVKGLRLTGVPVLWEGLYITIPRGNFHVAEACSGLRYLTASVALGFLYAYLTYRSVWRRLAFIALSMVMPIIANGARAYGIVMIAYLSDMKYATGLDHVIYGWFFFGLVILCMFWMGSFWREPEAVAGRESGIREPTKNLASEASTLKPGPWKWVLAGILATVYAVLTITHWDEMRYSSGINHLTYGWFFLGLFILIMFVSCWREPETATGQESVIGEQTRNLVPGAWHLKLGAWGTWTLAVVLAAAVGPLWATWTSREGLSVAPVVLQAPPAVAPWLGPEAETDTWEPQFIGADAVVLSRYALEGQTVHLYIAYYRQQRPDAKLVSSQNSLYDRERWRSIGAAGVVQIPVAESRWPLQATWLTDGQRRRLVWSGYWEGGRLVVSPYIAKLWQAWDRLSGAQRGSALVAIAADYDIQPDEAEGLLRRFLETVGPGIDTALVGAGQRDSP